MKLLQDNQGNFSSNRLLKLVFFAWLIWISTILLYAGANILDVAYFLGIGMGTVVALTAYAKKKETESEKIAADLMLKSKNEDDGEPDGPDL